MKTNRTAHRLPLCKSHAAAENDCPQTPHGPQSESKSGSLHSAQLICLGFSEDHSLTTLCLKIMEEYYWLLKCSGLVIKWPLSPLPHLTTSKTRWAPGRALGSHLWWMILTHRVLSFNNGPVFGGLCEENAAQRQFSVLSFSFVSRNVKTPTSN